MSRNKRERNRDKVGKEWLMCERARELKKLKQFNWKELNRL